MPVSSSALSGHGSGERALDRLEHVGVDRVGRPSRIDAQPALRRGRGKAPVGVAHLLLERTALALEAIVLGATRGGLVEVELEQERDVGLEALGGEPVHARDLLDAEAAGVALVGQR